MTIQELIDKLTQIKEEKGNINVYTGGTDYPSDVNDVTYISERKTYLPENTVFIGNRTGCG